MYSEEGSDEAQGEDEGPREPVSLFWAILLPFYQILESTAPMSHIQDAADHEGWMIVYQPGSWSEVGLGAQGTLGTRLYLRNVERGMDPHCRR